MGHWYVTTPFDKQAARLYDRHYSRAVLWPQSVGKNQITIANSLVLVTADYSALWCTAWQNPIARNDGLDIWKNQIFRNESDILSSELINEAVAITRWRWFPAIPKDGFRTYIAADLVQSEIPGYCYRRATPRWKSIGLTKSRKLVTLVLSPEQLAKVQPLEAPRIEDRLQMAFNW